MLSALRVENAKGRAKPYLLTDGDGLHLMVTPSGSKLWRLRYRFRGKQNIISLGSFPAVSLADARGKRSDAQKLIASGVDPSQQRKHDKIASANAAKNTFGLIAEEHLQNLEESGTAASTMRKNRWYLLDLAADLRERPITEITAAEILTILKRIEKSGRRETARKVRGIVGAVFRLAISTLRATNDPTYPLRRALLKPNVQHRAAIIDEARLGALMAAIDDYDGWPTIRAALLLTALTMTRPGEVRFMRRREIIWPKSVWQIPAERMKMRVPHDVPLSKQALAILRDIWPLSEGHELVLPSIRSPRKPLSENAFNSALRRLGHTKEEVCAHGFRSSASTILNERGYASDVIEAALAHQDRNEVRKAYNRSKYWPQRVQLLQDWADLLDQFRALSATKMSA
jgi:integrase